MINKKFQSDTDWTTSDGRTVLLEWITKGQCRAVFGLNYRWVVKYAYWQGGQSNQIECEMYRRVPHLLPQTFQMDARCSCILQSRGEFTLDALLGGPMTTRHLIPLLAKLCEYLRRLTHEAFGHRLRIKDFSPRNVAFFGGGMSPQGWACCDFGNWELLSPASCRDASHAQRDVLSRLESSDHWARRTNTFACVSSWLVSRPGEHTAEQAADYLTTVIAAR